MAAPSDTRLLALLADELDAACAQLERLGIVLVGDGTVARRHMTELQALDHAGQRCTEIARILRAEDPRAAARAASLESIATRVAG